MSRWPAVLALGLWWLTVPVASAAPAERLAPAALPETRVVSLRPPHPAVGSIERLDPALDKLVASDAAIERLASGFKWAEGPLWVKSMGQLLFTDVPHNVVYRWKEGEGVSVFMRPSGYHGSRPDLPEPGANGLALDRKGRLLMCQHGDRRVARLDDWAKPSGDQTALAERYDGKRLNSPNDLVLHKSGDLFFTDPPYGLPMQTDRDPDKELRWNGVYRLSPEGRLTLLWDRLERPNGIALSPDHKTLYVANSWAAHPVWMAFDVTSDRGVTNPRVFFDATALIKSTGRKGGNDGIAVDRAGNLFATGPGGVLVFSPAGKHLGTLLTGGPTSNCKFGMDGSTLFITSGGSLLRVQTRTRGLGF